jgi:membrane-associated phospholipid phosphatase
MVQNIRACLRKFLIVWVFGSTTVAMSPTQAWGEGYDPIQHMWQGTKDMFKSDNADLFIWGSAATVASALFLDQPIKRYFNNDDRLRPYDELGNNFLGTGALGVGIALVTLAHGFLADNDKSKNSGEAHLEALAANLVYTTGLKYAIPHERPDSGDHYSFPSGHTSTMFASTGILMEFYGPYVGYPFMALAAYTGICRLTANRHYLSDVIFGGTLGYIVGRSYSQHHLRSLEKQANYDFAWSPYFEDHEAGAVATFIF